MRHEASTTATGYGARSELYRTTHVPRRSSCCPGTGTKEKWQPTAWHVQGRGSTYHAVAHCPHQHDGCGGAGGEKEGVGHCIVGEAFQARDVARPSGGARRADTCCRHARPHHRRHPQGRSGGGGVGGVDGPDCIRVGHGHKDALPPRIHCQPARRGERRRARIRTVWRQHRCAAVASDAAASVDDAIGDVAQLHAWMMKTTMTQQCNLEKAYASQHNKRKEWVRATRLLWTAEGRRCRQRAVVTT